MMKEQCDIERWTYDHKEMKLEHRNEDHGNRALGDGEGVKRSRQTIGICFYRSKMSREMIDQI
jgi:hypothetical protein